MNGNTTGIVPTFPINGGNNDGFFGGDGIWAIVLLALLFNNGMWGMGGFGGFGGGFGGMYEFPWLLTGQQGINANTNAGFDTLHLSNQIEGVRDGVNGLSNQLCNCCADMTQTVTNGFASAEVANNARQMANMQQAFNNQITTLQGFNNLGSQFADCCCENRLGIANLTSTVLAENCADREALSNGIRDIITNQTSNTQRILDQLCQDKIDSKNEKINDLQREILMKDLQASQIAQTAQLRAGQIAEVDALYDRLNNCPVGTVPVYGRQPIFSCNNGCGCSGSLYGTNI